LKTQGDALTTQGKQIGELETSVKDQGGRLTTAEGALKTQGDKIGALEKNALLHDGTAYNANHNGTKNRIINVENGVDVSDAATVGQLDDLKQSLNAGKTGLVQNDPAGDEIKIGGDSTANTVNIGGKTPELDDNDDPVKDANGNTVMIDADRTLTGVADGVEPNDAVNKSQLDAVEEKADNAQLAADNAQITADASAEQLEGIGAHETVAGRIAEASETVGKSVAGVLGGGATADKDGKVTMPSLKLTSLGNDANGRPVTQPSTIVDGLNAVDAVVKGQGDRLTTTEGTVLKQDGILATATKDIADQGGKIAELNKNDEAFNTRFQGVDQTVGDLKKQLEAEAKLAAENDDMLDTVVNHVDSLDSKLGNLENKAVAYDTTPDGKKTNQLTLQGGDLNAPVLIKNVAEGKDDTDAANVAQVKKATVEANTYTDKAATTTLTKSKTYTDEVATTTLTKSYEYTDTALTKVGNLSETVNGIDGRTGALETRTGALEKGFDQLSSDIKSVRKEAHQAAAVGLAASSLRFDNTPGKVSVAMGGAVWRDQGAMAFGAGYTSESGKIRTNLTGATSGGEFGVSAGISFTLN
ncbi:YadA-like family protein, partial [Phyllobacterium sp. YR531]|uniref:YadA-like family protein n=1 Tax=Phyllobacterium sp. YR531 TaxID=1144343 RepID=UPI001872DB52